MNADEADGVPMAEVNIRNVILERKAKAERQLVAEQKRQVDLQRIRDMRSTTGVDPLQHFPKEVWNMIFDELDADDRANVWKVHPLFRDLMEETQVRDIMFPQMLHFNPLNYWINVFDTRDFKHERLRMVSKSMRNSFDHWMENNLIKLMHGEELDDSVPHSCFNLVEVKLSESDQLLERLLRSFQGENCAKRFFRRGFSVYFNEDEENTLEEINQFKDKITALLEIFGDQIWYFRLRMHPLELDEYSFSQAYILLLKWISLMPNLKWLEIDFDASEDDGNDEETPTFLRSNPFPQIDSLEKITLILGHPPEKTDTIQLYASILEANQHITILDIQARSDGRLHLQLLPVRVIQSLELSNFRLQCEKISLDAIQSIINFNWQLTKITLELEKWRKWSLNSLFRFLERFPTLKEVTLEISKRIRIDKNNQLGYLDLPNLTKFDISISKPKINYKARSDIHFFFSLQFLLKCKKLKALKWSIHNFDDVKLRAFLVGRECRWRMIDFRAGLRFLYESNIWDVFPRLETVYVDFKKQNAGEEEAPCVQEYHRGVRDARISVGEFLKEHICCYLNRLQNCAILFG